MNKRIPPYSCLDFYNDIDSWEHSYLLGRYYVLMGGRNFILGNSKKITLILDIL